MARSKSHNFSPAELVRGRLRHVYRDHSESFPVLDWAAGGVGAAYPAAGRVDGYRSQVASDYSHSLPTLDQLLESKK